MGRFTSTRSRPSRSPGKRIARLEKECGAEQRPEDQRLRQFGKAKLVHVQWLASAHKPDRPAKQYGNKGEDGKLGKNMQLAQHQNNRQQHNLPGEKYIALAQLLVHRGSAAGVDAYLHKMNLVSGE